MRKMVQMVRRSVGHVRGWKRLHGDWKLLAAGVACLIAAVFPGPVEIPGVTTLPTLTTMPQRVLAGFIGLGLLLFGALIETDPAQAIAPARPLEESKHVPDVRRRMILRVRRFWIDDVLTQSLSGVDHLELRLSRRLDVIVRPLDFARPTRQRQQETNSLPPGTSIGEVFEELDQALLILGPPGGGKTTLLLELLRHLLEEASRDESTPVPVVFNLSSWKTGLPIAQWLDDELHKRYGVPSRIAHEWIDGDLVIPLLDGLDEVAATYRARCIKAINAFREEHSLIGIAICCRTDDYVALGAQLRLGGAVMIDELDSSQMADYLRSAGPSLAGVRAVLRDDPVLAELLRAPLMLNLVASAYRDRSPRRIRSSGSAPQRRDDILGAYIDAMFISRPRHLRWTRQRMLLWLSWLARSMLDQGLTVFQFEWMQPDLLLKRWQRWLVTAAPSLVAVALVLLLIFLPPLGVLGAPPRSLDSSQLDYWAFAMLFLVPVLLVSFERKIRPWDELSWSRNSLRRTFRRSFVWGLVLALSFYVAFALGLWLQLDRRPILTDARIVATVTVLIGISIWLVSALEGRLVEHHDRPNQGIRTSARNALILGGPLVALGVLGAQAEGISAAVWAPFLTLAGLLVALRVGGRAVIQHAALRAILASDGAAPLRYVHLLDSAVDLVLMRRVGGGYVFLHRLLLEHLARPTTPVRSTTS